eukprot:GHVU01007355.1.p3 GENE.GHVU01007355.1~~GHVU01007355.1.p3  ORF type:complete len:115 (+),score=6.01 GHVU01007355.1:1063-1407(+)
MDTRFDGEVRRHIIRHSCFTRLPAALTRVGSSPPTVEMRAPAAALGEPVTLRSIEYSTMSPRRQQLQQGSVFPDLVCYFEPAIDSARVCRYARFHKSVAELPPHPPTRATTIHI